jgi:hypothetical protein
MFTLVGVLFFIQLPSVSDYITSSNPRFASWQNTHNTVKKLIHSLESFSTKPNFTLQAYVWFLISTHTCTCTRAHTPAPTCFCAVALFHDLWVVHAIIPIQFSFATYVCVFSVCNRILFSQTVSTTTVSLSSKPSSGHIKMNPDYLHFMLIDTCIICSINLMSHGQDLLHIHAIW